jgi:hypothetical protein
MQQTFLDFTSQQKSEKLFTESGKFDYMRSEEHAVLTYEKYHYSLKKCLQSLFLKISRLDFKEVSDSIQIYMATA